jgi:hypothetical protein
LNLLSGTKLANTARTDSGESDRTLYFRNSPFRGNELEAANAGPGCLKVSKTVGMAIGPADGIIVCVDLLRRKAEAARLFESLGV